ncbi:SpoIIE family protein phosphatase [Streptomyces sp. GMR22]|nr:SpoIIE family protein phosphatase [Streptomyces sp. GMR22]
MRAASTAAVRSASNAATWFGDICTRAVRRSSAVAVGSGAVARLLLRSCWHATSGGGAHAEALIGGDFYAVRGSPFGVRALIGDVRGKGLPAVSTMAVATSAFREAAEQWIEWSSVAEYIFTEIVTSPKLTAPLQTGSHGRCPVGSRSDTSLRLAGVLSH